MNNSFEINLQNVKYTLSWNQYNLDVHLLAGRIKQGRRKFKNMYGLVRGGWPIVVQLSHLLKLPVLETPKEVTRNTLIVDDVSDTGKTLAPYKKRGLRIATLYRKDHTITEPDYCIRTLNMWIVYPYEI